MEVRGLEKRVGRRKGGSMVQSAGKFREIRFPELKGCWVGVGDRGAEK